MRARWDIDEGPEPTDVDKNNVLEWYRDCDSDAEGYDSDFLAERVKELRKLPVVGTNQAELF